MARKATLDILEIHNDEQPAELESLQLPELEPDDQPQPLRARLQKKLIVTCVIVVCICFIAGGGTFFWMKAGKEEVALLPDSKLRPVTATDGMGHNMASLDGFVVDYREKGDTIRLAIFALAVELNKPVKRDLIENQVTLRGDIYTLSKKRSLSSLASPEGRGILRSEITAELDKRLGAGMVKAVYFTKFYIL